MSYLKIKENVDLEELKKNVIVPEYIYRIVFNKNYNDFNNEKEFKIVKYKVFAYDKSENKYWVEAVGFKGKCWVSSNVYFTKQEAEEALKKLEEK